MMRFFRKDGETLAILSLRDIYKQAKVAPGGSVAAFDKRSGFPYSGIQLTDGILTLSEHRSPLHLPPQGITVIDVQRTHINSTGEEL